MEEEEVYKDQPEFALRYGELDNMPGKRGNNLIVLLGVGISVVAALIIFITISAINASKIMINFDTDGASIIAGIEIKKGSTVELPQPTRDGYVFEGWYNGDAKVGDDTTYDENTTLVAHWISANADTYSIAFDSNGGTKVESITAECDKELKLPANPTRTDYKFVAWVDQNNVKIYDGALLACKDISLKASWKKDDDAEDNNPNSVHKITFDRETIDLIVGTTDVITATVEPETALNKSIIWSSSDPEIISVDPGGLVTARAIGSATITAKTSNGKTATVKAYSDVRSITLTKNVEYISNYEEFNYASNISVSTDPYVDLEEKDYIWNSPETSGTLAAATLEAKGESATLTAKNVSSDGPTPVRVTVTIGRISSPEEIVYVEPKLLLSSSSVQIALNQEATITASTDIADWGATGLLPESFEVQTNRTERKFVVRPVLINGSEPRPLTITATTRAGQRASITINCIQNGS